MKSRVGIIGMGMAGGNMTEYFAKRSYEALAINTSADDLSNINVAEAVKLEGADGVGKDRDKAKKVTFSNMIKGVSLFDKIERKFQHKDVIYIITSLSGGTGSGGTPVIVSELNRLWKEEDVAPKIINLIAILPPDSEIDGITILNTRNALLEFHGLMQMGHINNIMLIDNNSGTVDIVNKKFCTLANSIIDVLNGNTYANFDTAEQFETITYKGYSYIGKLNLSYYFGKNTNETDCSIFQSDTCILESDDAELISAVMSIKDMEKYKGKLENEASRLVELDSLIKELATVGGNNPKKTFKAINHNPDAVSIGYFAGLSRPVAIFDKYECKLKEIEVKNKVSENKKKERDDIGSINLDYKLHSYEVAATVSDELKSMIEVPKEDDNKTISRSSRRRRKTTRDTMDDIEW
ncbi:hypothetical protein IZY60_06580 [Lutibacter sp. B2]|nr:hypothetical protein [Lutibacter sp. B2]